ncbi:hypothetical protein JAAARDRAFT_197540 [Jaapia argillacea MUCL 33604]|uniref:F-box domain-containing protein n=1 Tax=Jaapia argillacea MUCL 33604 TaxID=933084 RepID=A0A067PHS3_9AGAM|nr:hypothetical protein JAAARDRAFT_197540 [Jaapia argillacea MUCL 33604]
MRFISPPTPYSTCDFLPPISSHHDPTSIFRISDLSLELVDSILSCITKPTDLLALSLTCHTFHDLLIRHQITYSISLADHTKLDALIHHPTLAHNIRRLDVQVHLGKPTPETVEMQKRGEEKLVRALRKMHNLVAFRWLYCDTMGKEVIWSTLRDSCPRLASVTVYESGPKPRAMEYSSLVGWTNLQEFCIILRARQPHELEPRF